VIAARLDTLPVEYKQLLQAAAVVGHTFWAGAAATLTDTDQTVVSARLHDLVRRDYLRPSRSSSIAGQPEYAFNHALIADVAYSQLPRQIRATHHRAAGDWHTTLSMGMDPDTEASAPSGEQAAVVAHHYTQAHTLTTAAGGDPSGIAEIAALAVDWHARAARQSQQLNLGAAETHVKAALDLTPLAHNSHPRLLILLGDIVSSAGRSSDAESFYRRAHEEAFSEGSAITAAHADTCRSGVLASLARLSEATALLERTVKILEAHPPGEELLEGYVASAGELYMRGLDQPSVDRANQALALAETLDEPPPRLLERALQIRGSSRAWSGDRVGGEQDLLRALDIARTHNITSGMIGIEGELGLLKWLTQSASAALPHLERALDLAVERGRTASLVSQSANLGEALAVAGRIDDALATCERAAVAIANTDSPLATAFLQLTHSWVLTIRGDFEPARALVAQALPVARGADASTLVATLLQAVTCANAIRDPEPVDTVLEELVTALHDPDLDAALPQFLPRLARILCPTGHGDLVSRVVGHAPSDLLLYGNNVVTARAILMQAEGDYDQALHLYERAAIAWAGYGYPLEQAHALLGAARCSLTLDLPSRALVLQARKILTRLGAEPLVAETDHLLNVCG
jgi:tetratricopeptide (TPR) repeat protein